MNLEEAQKIAEEARKWAPLITRTKVNPVEQFYVECVVSYYEDGDEDEDGQTEKLYRGRLVKIEDEQAWENFQALWSEKRPQSFSAQEPIKLSDKFAEEVWSTYPHTDINLLKRIAEKYSKDDL